MSKMPRGGWLESEVKPRCLRDGRRRRWNFKLIRHPLALNIHEEQFIKNFIVPQKRERYLSMFESSKGRSKLIQTFYHLPDLDERFAIKIESNEQSLEAIHRILQSKGAPRNCHVISTDNQIDGNEMPLLDVLEKILDACKDGSFVSCIPGKLGYFEGEDVDTRLIFEKK